MPSPPYRTALDALAPERAPIFALEITHPDFTQPVRVVNDTEPAILEGNRFEPMAFELVVAGEHEQQRPTARLRLDNIGALLTEPLERSGGARGAVMRALQFLRGDDQIEWSAYFSIRGLSVSQFQITFDLTHQLDLSAPAAHRTWDRILAPAL